MNSLIPKVFYAGIFFCSGITNTGAQQIANLCCDTFSQIPQIPQIHAFFQPEKYQ